MANEFIITTIVGILTGLGGWFSARKKNNADARMSELDVVEKAIAVWRQMSEDMQKRYDDLRKRYDSLLERQNAIEDELQGLREDNHRLSRENKTLVNKLKKYSPNDAGIEGKS